MRTIRLKSFYVESTFLLVLFVTSLASGEVPLCQKIFTNYRTNNVQIPAETILQAAVFVHENRSAFQFLNRNLQSKLKELADGSQEFEKVEIFLKIVEKIKNQIGADRLREYIGKILRSTRQTMDNKVSRITPADRKDTNRIFGWKLLSDSDPIFSDPQYLEAQLRTTGMSGSGGFFGGDEASQWASNLFRSEWQKIAPKNTQVERFTVTGAQANALVYEVARAHTNPQLRTQVEKAGQEVHFLVMSNMWVATDKARATHLHFSFPGTKTLAEKLTISAPYTYEPNPTSPREIARLKIIEDQALQMIEKKYRDESIPVGALLLEPILGAGGVQFFRTEFMLRLRALCDQLHLPIVADEILSGGGRTGKFFAYQNYADFEPDYITFGKGLQVAGLASVERGKNYANLATGMVTSSAIPHSLIKSAFIMRRLREGHLLENAAEVGAYFLERLRQIELQENPREKAEFAERDFNWRSRARGLGLFLNYGSRIQSDLMGGNQSRATPFLSITKADVDFLLSKRTTADDDFERGLQKIVDPQPLAAEILHYSSFSFKTNSAKISAKLLEKTAAKYQVVIAITERKIGEFNYFNLVLQGSLESIKSFKKSLRKVLDNEAKRGFRWDLGQDARTWNSTQKIISVQLTNMNAIETEDLRGYMWELSRQYKQIYYYWPNTIDDNVKIWLAVPRDQVDHIVSSLVFKLAKNSKLSIEVKDANLESQAQ